MKRSNFGTGRSSIQDFSTRDKVSGMNTIGFQYILMPGLDILHFFS